MHLKTLHTIALAIGAAFPYLAFSPAHAQAVAASAASAPAADTVRAEMMLPITAAQELVKAGRGQEALQKLGEVVTMPNQTPFETYVIARLRGSAALRANDFALAVSALTFVADHPKLPPEDRPVIARALAESSYRIKDYPGTVRWAQAYYAGGGNSEEPRMLMAQSLYLSDNYAGASEQISQIIKTADAAGKVPDEVVFRLQASVGVKAKDDTLYETALRRLVMHYPSKEYWADLLSRVERRPTFAERLSLDALRLRRALGQMTDGADYDEMAQRLQRAGFPNEALRMLDEGYAAGLVGKGPEAARQKKLHDTLAKAALDDRKELEKADISGTKAKDGDVLVKLGYALVSIGQNDKGLELMERGVARGDGPRLNDTRLLLGATQYALGQKDKAAQTFKAVTGADGAGELAQLWQMLIAGKR